MKIIEKPLVVGGYELYSAIAAGGMATIHLARTAEPVPAGVNRAFVVIKRLRAERAAESEFVTMFLDEARLTANIHHENVVETFEILYEDGELFLVMEYVIGDSLSRLTKTYALPSFNVASRVVADMLHGLHAAHRACGADGTPLHIIHRDVSPQNVLVSVDGIAKLIDFGVAKAVGRMQHTRDGEIKGKIAYMPPEQLIGRPSSAQSDIYSAGVVLWEFLAGRRLFRGDNEGAIVTKIIRGEIPRVRDIWSTEAKHTLSMLAQRDLAMLDAITMRALALEPTERFSSAEEMAFALEEALEPASRDEVTEWVKNAARDLLASRASFVAAIVKSDLDKERAPESEPPTLMRASPLRPIIVANLVGQAARDFLLRVAASGGTVLVPLLNAPLDASEHILEVHIPNEPEPTLFSARPAGPPKPSGFPLTLRAYGEPTPEPGPTLTLNLPTGQVEAHTFTSHTLSEGHTRDLTNMNATDHVAPVEADVLGRIIAKGTLELEARIGGGGGGSVYRARHCEFRAKVVAVKVLHDSARHDLEFTERFHAEALAASRLDHVNLVRVLDFGQEPDGLLYLSMEFLNGWTLRHLIDRERRLSATRAIDIMLQVCAGLGHAHAHGIIHRDIKPSNVVLVSKVDDDGRPIEVVKVCDFGIALQRTEEFADTPAPRVAGTPEYMSPEQCRGADVDARSDVYACGVMLFELATGQLPFPRRQDLDQRLHAAEAPTLPSRYVPDIDPLLEQVILRALAKDPDNRFASMIELRAALKELLDPAFVVDVDVESAEEDDQPPTSSRDEGKLAEKLAHELAVDPTTRMRALVFERESAMLEAAIPILARNGDVASLVIVLRALTGIHRAAPNEATADAAQRLINTVANPATLTPLAERLLSAGTEPTEEEAQFFGWAQSGGAIALYNARINVTSSAARTRFVVLMRRLGAPAVPVIRSALEHISERVGVEDGYDLQAVDLLRSIPHAQDEGLGAVVAPHVSASNPELACAALAVIVDVWGGRSKSLLLAALRSKEHAVALEALRGLKATGGVDEFVMRKVGTSVPELRQKMLGLLELTDVQALPGA